MTWHAGASKSGSFPGKGRTASSPEAGLPAHQLRREEILQQFVNGF